MPPEAASALKGSGSALAAAAQPSGIGRLGGIRHKAEEILVRLGPVVSTGDADWRSGRRFTKLPASGDCKWGLTSAPSVRRIQPGSRPLTPAILSVCSP